MNSKKTNNKNISSSRKHNKKITKYYNLYNNNSINNTFSYGDWEGKECYKPIDQIHPGWSFKIYKNKYTVSLEASSEFSSSGIGLKVRCFLSKYNDNVFKWHTDGSPFNFSWNIENEDIDSVHNEIENKEVKFELSIKSVDEKYSKWFDIFKIDQDGVSLKINSFNHKELFDQIFCLNDLLEKMKARVLLESFT